jgi:two-component system NtrC family sensor kinase
MINLITNACHALGSKGGELRIRTGNRENGWLMVTVADSGCGIPEANLPCIFEPFFTTKPPGEGTGLGLSIVKKIVDFHLGSIMVNSVPGQGTTLEVRFPPGSPSGTNPQRPLAEH